MPGRPCYASLDDERDPRDLEQALALPDEERELLLIQLEASLEPDADWEAAWAEESTRRMADFDAGKEPAQSWEEVRAELYRGLAAKQAK